MRSHKIAITAACFAVAMVIGTSAFAQSPAPAPTDQSEHHGDPAMHEARKACAASVAKGADGHPDHEAMKACMKSKGFTLPEHGHEHGAGGPPPNASQGAPPQGNPQ